MKVLVTGGSGFLGGYVLSGLRRYGIDTVVAGRHWPSWDATTDFIKIDLLGTSDFAPLFAESDVTHLLHLAWYAEHGDYWTSSINLRWVEATVRLVEAFCESGGQKVVVAGSCAEYEWGPGLFFEDRSTVNPASLYGVAKDAGRRLIMAICERHQVPCAWGRIFFPFGAGEDGRRLIPSLIKVFQGEHPPFGVRALSCLDFLHAADVAEGFIKLLDPHAIGVYNASSG
ncbi:MAG: NAD-dependent epimerase/dehydratase family protein, partial [Rhodospirillales bacterium]|nr:NAD-dependent epimerase/dehydratase family protein [Rhodospirillales bacterium]